MQISPEELQKLMDEAVKRAMEERDRRFFQPVSPTYPISPTIPNPPWPYSGAVWCGPGVVAW